MPQKFIDNLVGLPTLWAAIKDKFVAKEAGKGLSTNDYTDSEKKKLAGVANNANNYSLPPATSSSLGGIIVGDNLTVAADGTLDADVSNQYHMGIDDEGYAQLIIDSEDTTHNSFSTYVNSIQAYAQKIETYYENTSTILAGRSISYNSTTEYVDITWTAAS